MSLKFRHVLLAIGLILLLSRYGMAFEVDVTGDFLFPTVTGENATPFYKMTPLSPPGTVSRTDQSLVPEIEIGTVLGRHQLSLSYASESIDKTTVSQLGPISVNGTSLKAGDLAASHADFDMLDFRYQYDILDLNHILSGFSLGVVSQVKLIEGGISTTTEGVKSTTPLTTQIPMLGLNLSFDIHPETLKARLSATGSDSEGKRAFDSQVDITYTPLPYLDIHGGYRVLFIGLEDEDVSFTSSTVSPFVGITLSF